MPFRKSCMSHAIPQTHSSFYPSSVFSLIDLAKNSLGYSKINTVYRLVLVLALCYDTLHMGRDFFSIMLPTRQPRVFARLTSFNIIS